MIRSGCRCNREMWFYAALPMGISRLPILHLKDLTRARWRTTTGLVLGAGGGHTLPHRCLSLLVSDLPANNFPPCRAANFLIFDWALHPATVVREGHRILRSAQPDQTASRKLSTLSTYERTKVGVHSKRSPRKFRMECTLRFSGNPMARLLVVVLGANRREMHTRGGGSSYHYMSC
jgi:hypothetical protein